MDKLKLEKIVLTKAITDITVIKNCTTASFTDEDITTIFKLAKDFVEKYGTLPTKDNLYYLVTDSGYEMSKSVFNALFDINLNDFNSEFIDELVQNTILWKDFQSNLFNAITYVKSQKVDLTNVANTIEKARSIINATNLNMFDDDLGSRFSKLDDHFTPFENSVPSTHQWLDDRIGGFRIGTLNMYCGFANVGKSLLLCNDASNHILKGRDVVYISLEMSEDEVMQRVGGNVLDIDIYNYSRNDKKPVIQKFFNDLYTYQPPGELFVKQFPSSTATIDTIKSYLLKLSNVYGKMPKILIIDYLGLMATKSQFNSDYSKLKDIATQLRSLAVEFGLVIISAAQLTRSANNTSDFDMEHLSDSIELARVADNLIGIIQTSEMYQDNQYHLKILKVRRALKKCKGSRCVYNVEYAKMRMLETDEVIE